MSPLAGAATPVFLLHRRPLLLEPYNSRKALASPVDGRLAVKPDPPVFIIEFQSASWGAY